MKLNFFEDIISNVPNQPRNLIKRRLKNLPVIGENSPLAPKVDDVSLPFENKLWSGLLLLFLSMFVTLAFLGKTYVLQVIKGEDNLALSDENRIRVFHIQAERGVVYDRNGTILVRNKPAFAVELNKNICGEHCLQEVENLSKFIKLDYVKVRGELEANRAITIIATNLTKEDVLPIEANLIEMPSISISTVPQRDYIFKNDFSHVIGYVGFGDTLHPTIEGKDGVELSYNEYLTGFPGSKIVQVNSLGQPIQTISEKKPFPGRNITLFIDSALQMKATALLKDVVDSGHAEAGVVVAQDPSNGGVLALVSYPNFDPAKLSGRLTTAEYQSIQSSSNSPFFNRAISAAYPPGSTFKMGVVAAALSEGNVTPETEIFDPGYLKIGDFIYRNWKLDGHGSVNAYRALQVSNDVYLYTIGGGHGSIRGLGITKLHDWMLKFGYGNPTGIDLAGEIPGFMPDGTHREWYLGDSFITAIGQGDVLATPLQVNNATVYFSNGGKLYRPRVVREVDGLVNSSPEVLADNIISDDIYSLIKDSMRAVTVYGGTAYPFFDFADMHNGVEVGGKTGTAEYIDPWGKERTHAWFTVFGPYEKPEIAITVFLEGGGSGSDDAAPIARELMDLWFENKDK